MESLALEYDGSIDYQGNSRDRSLELRTGQTHLAHAVAGRSVLRR